MDSAVIAALITTPTAVLAAAAAYAAGRAQARAAHRGPVDAVRRQHQRDAYAAFLVAAYSYADQTSEVTCQHEAERASGDEWGSLDIPQQLHRADVIRAAASADPLRAPGSVVYLEGPEHIGELAAEVQRLAYQVHMESRIMAELSPQGLFDQPLIFLDGEPLDPRAAHRRLMDAINGYASAARDHLNGIKPRDS
jgi:hypothetical protein